MKHRTSLFLQLIVLPLLVILLVPLALAEPTITGPADGSTPLPLSQPGIPGQPTVEMGGPSLEEQVVILSNQARWNNGQLPPLKHQNLLDNSSELHSSNMAVRNFFAHCDPDTLTMPWDRMTAAGYNWNAAAENIAAGYNSPSAVMAAWMASSGHRANILSTGYRELGVGYYYQSPDQANVRDDPQWRLRAR